MRFNQMTQAAEDMTLETGILVHVLVAAIFQIWNRNTNYLLARCC